MKPVIRKRISDMTQNGLVFDCCTLTKLSQEYVGAAKKNYRKLSLLAKKNYNAGLDCCECICGNKESGGHNFCTRSSKLITNANCSSKQKFFKFLLDQCNPDKMEIE